MKPRTIVLFMVDQLGAKWLETAGSGVVDLPNFNALLNESTEFRNAFSTNPVCSPSRANIATGLSASAHGVPECGYDLDPAVPTFMQALQRSDWVTGGFGKLHFKTQIQQIRPDYRPYGFDVVHNTEDTRAGEWLDWVRNKHLQHYEAAKSTVWMTMVPEMQAYGPDAVDLHAEILEAQRKYPESTQEAYELPFPAEVSQTAWITDRACEFLKATEGNLFAQISYVQPHNPFAPPAEFVDRVNVAAIPSPIGAEWQQDPIPYYRQERYAKASYDTADWKRQRQLYFADLAHLDHELGRVREVLKEAGRDKDTLFIFTSDHGEMLHDHGLLGKWERHYDACIRVPLIISAPDARSREVDELVEHSDIAATIYDWAGIPAPSLPCRRQGNDETMPMLHGRSLLPIMKGNTPADWRLEVFIQSNNNHVEASPKSWARTVRTNRYRFTRHLDGGGEQLFDLQMDPHEQRNLAYEKEWPDVRAGLLERLSELSATDSYPNSPRQLFQIGAW
ncbi:sulfatase [Paenarthrobacter sp. NPDC056912]|uniref:sulfatase family protein n=1 Tax=Paenarthrobacter sp. NPDC056912 TaxID=3345965 RepID=UPI00366CE637